MPLHAFFQIAGFQEYFAVGMAMPSLTRAKTVPAPEFDIILSGHISRHALACCEADYPADAHSFSRT